MADVGYSGTPLQKKLGLKEGWRVAFAGDPPKAFGDAFVGLDVRSAVRAPLHAVVLFAVWQKDLAARAPTAMKALGDTGMLWVAWPKKASGVPTDLTENVLRDMLLPTGWVDTKVCAVDETWSGLKFLKRLSERSA
ncbi:MAG: hypothetical protein QOK43_1702 [Acidimicrobiaceae bacterium]|nr:hypothetical protein [Acidimicrobiaceae bacterium]